MMNTHCRPGPLRHALTLGLAVCAWLASAMSAVSVASAQGMPETDTLSRIKQRGYITVGYREASVPFSFQGADGQVMGYSHDLAMRVVDAVRREINEPLLVLRLQSITSQDRIARIRSGDVDLECGSTTHNTLRARQVGFSNTLFIIGTRLLTARDSGIHDFPDLAGRTVVTTSGTTSERLLHRLNQERLLGVDIVTAQDHDASFLILQQGHADAFMMDDALLYGKIAGSGDPARWRVTGMPRSFEAYACMLPHGDSAFKRLVDRTLTQVMTSGEAERLYRKWFMSPLPGSDLNLNFPLSDTMRALYQAPNDKPFQ